MLSDGRERQAGNWSYYSLDQTRLAVVHYLSQMSSTCRATRISIEPLPLVERNDQMFDLANKLVRGREFP